jgi:hypothetical protein
MCVRGHREDFLDFLDTVIKVYSDQRLSSRSESRSDLRRCLWIAINFEQFKLH